MAIINTELFTLIVHTDEITNKEQKANDINMYVCPKFNSI